MRSFSKINAMIIDDNPLVVSGLLQFFDNVSIPKMDVVGYSTAHFKKMHMPSEISFTEFIGDVINYNEPELLITDISYEKSNKRGLVFGRKLILDTGYLCKVIYLSRHRDIHIYEPGETVVWKGFENAKTADSDFSDMLDLANEDSLLMEYLSKLFSDDVDTRRMKVTGKKIKKWRDDYPALFEILISVRSSIEKIKFGNNYRMFKLPTPLKMYLESKSGLLFSSEIQFWNRINVYQNNYSDVIVDVYESIIDSNKRRLFDSKRIAEYITSGKSDGIGVPNITQTIKNFKGCEPILYANIHLDGKQFSEKYRDHFYHTFHVFILGYIILEWLYDLQTSENVYIPEEKKNFLLSWFFASVFHDVGYIVSKSEKAISKFFEYFFSEKHPDQDNLNQVLGKKKFQNILSVISGYGASKGSNPHHCVNNHPGHCKKTHIESLLKSAFSYDKDHGVLSAVSFLDQYYSHGFKPDQVDPYLKSIGIEKIDGESYEKFVQKSIEEQIKEYVEFIYHGDRTNYSGVKPPFIKDYAEMHEKVILPAAFSMAIHNTLFKNIGTIVFEEDPLSFLLIFCDISQEYGRPKGLNSSSEESDIIELVGINYSSENVNEGAEVVSDRRIPYFEIILGISHNERFRGVYSQASLVFEKHLSSSTVDFRLILINITNAPDYEKYFHVDTKLGTMDLIKRDVDSKDIKVISTI